MQSWEKREGRGVGNFYSVESGWKKITPKTYISNLTYPRLYRSEQTYKNLSQYIPNLSKPIQTYLSLSKPIPNRSKHIYTYPNLSIQTYLSLYQTYPKYFFTYSNLSKPIRTYPNLSKPFQLDCFGSIQCYLHTVWLNLWICSKYWLGSAKKHSPHFNLIS